MTNNPFDEGNLVKSNWVKFSKIGDNIFGTLVSVREQLSNLPDRQGEKQKVYEIKADGGEYHDIDGKKQVVEPGVKILPGDVFNIGGSDAVDSQMRNVRIGTKIGIRFDDEKESKTKGYNPTKIKRVYVQKDKSGQPLMDTAWLEEQKNASDPFAEAKEDIPF